jgi:hypothetical protein
MPVDPVDPRDAIRNLVELEEARLAAVEVAEKTAWDAFLTSIIAELKKIKNHPGITMGIPLPANTQNPSPDFGPLPTFFDTEHCRPAPRKSSSTCEPRTGPVITPDQAAVALERVRDSHVAIDRRQFRVDILDMVTAFAPPAPADPGA